MTKQCFLTSKGPKALGPYSTAVEAGGTVYLSGMLGIDPATGKLQEGVLKQAEQMLHNIRTVLEEMGLSMDSIVKATVFMADLKDFTAVNALYGQAFGENFPARSCIQAAGLPMGAAIEMECVAMRGE